MDNILHWYDEQSHDLQRFDSNLTIPHGGRLRLCPRFMRCRGVCFPKLKPSRDKKNKQRKKIQLQHLWPPFCSQNFIQCLPNLGGLLTRPGCVGPWDIAPSSVLRQFVGKTGGKELKNVCVCGFNQHHVMTWLEFVLDVKSGSSVHQSKCNQNIRFLVWRAIVPSRLSARDLCFGFLCAWKLSSGLLSGSSLQIVGFLLVFEFYIGMQPPPRRSDHQDYHSSTRGSLISVYLFTQLL